MTRVKWWQALEKRCEDLKLLRCLMRPSLRSEDQKKKIQRLLCLHQTRPRSFDTPRQTQSGLLSHLRLGLIRHRGSFRSSHLSSQVLPRFYRGTLEPAGPPLCALWRRLSLHLSLFTVSQVPLIYH